MTGNLEVDEKRAMHASATFVAYIRRARSEELPRVPHTSDVGSLLRVSEDSERGSTRTFDCLCFFTFSILDRFGPHASAIPNAVRLLEMRSFGFDSHRPLHKFAKFPLILALL